LEENNEATKQGPNERAGFMLAPDCRKQEKAGFQLVGSQFFPIQIPSKCTQNYEQQIY
jgi:hypothetical protein